jgi:hypothetical protein
MPEDQNEHYYVENKLYIPSRTRSKDQESNKTKKTTISHHKDHKE